MDAKAEPLDVPTGPTSHSFDFLAVNAGSHAFASIKQEKAKNTYCEDLPTGPLPNTSDEQAKKFDNVEELPVGPVKTEFGSGSQPTTTAPIGSLPFSLPPNTPTNKYYKKFDRHCYRPTYSKGNWRCPSCYDYNTPLRRTGICGRCGEKNPHWFDYYGYDASSDDDNDLY